jgi:hypothetical protein
MAGVSEQPGRYTRSFGGLVAAMAVLVVLVGGYVLVRSVFYGTDTANPVQPIAYQQPVHDARHSADFHLLAPRSLPPGWIATSVRFTDGDDQAWHLGALTAGAKYVGLEQAERSAPDMVEEFVDPDATRGSDRTIDGQTWQTWSDAGGDQALVRETHGVTTVLVGPVPESTLENYLATLR